MAHSRHLGKSKNRHAYTTVRLIAITKFVTMTQVDPLDRSDREISDWK